MEILMSLDFRKLDIKRIKQNISNLYPTISTKDPVFGDKTLRETFWTSGVIKHGNLIQETLLEIIKASPGWEGMTEFSCLPSSTNGRKAFIDNIAINKADDIAICIECKKNYENTSGPYKGNINRYKTIINRYSKEILDELGLTGTRRKIYFGVFNAYGKSNVKFKDKIRFIYPEDLPKIFPSCVQEGWRAFEKEMTRIYSEKDLLDPDFLEKAKNYDDFRKLEQKHLNNPVRIPDSLYPEAYKIRDFFDPRKN